jgi:hypothetical protein
MSRIKHVEHPSAQHLRAQAASIWVLAAAVKSSDLLTRLEEKAQSCERRAIELELSDTDQTQGIADV